MNKTIIKRIFTLTLVMVMLLSVLTPLPGTTNATTNESSVDPEDLKGNNWMSLISGDRYLNEINIPGTHEAGMANSKPSGVMDSLGSSYGKTQSLSIRDQINSGVRMLDIRMTNRVDYEDTSDNVYIVHGSNEGFDARFYSYKKKQRIVANNNTYYRYTYYTVNDAMSEIAEFLKNNPTETVLIEMGYEAGSGDEDKTYAKAQKLLNQYAAMTNPSTGKSYIYTENGSKIINNMPTMGDTRGQMVILSKNTTALGYGIEYSAPNGYAINAKLAGKTYSFENHYEADKSHKLDYVKNFYNGGTVNKWPTSGTQAYGTDSIKAQIQDIPKDVTTHVNKGNIIYTSSNVEWAHWKKLGDSPKEIADEVNPYLYGSEGLFNTRGKLYGWVYSDFVDADMARMLYLTNFPTGEGTLNYKKVTFKNGEEEYIYYVLAGENFALIDDISETQDGITFTGWTKEGDAGTVYKAGQKVKITEDTIFNARKAYTWKGLNQYISKQNSGTVNIKLTGDLESTEADETIAIPRGLTVNLDLNGYKVNGGSKSSDRPNFSIYGNLKVTSSGIGSGIITGGKSAKGGAFFVAPGGELTIGNGILVTGNKSPYGGGVYLSEAENGLSAATATIENATITGNEATVGSGGGIYAPSGTTVQLSGKVIIRDNTGKIFKSGVSNLHVDKSATPVISLTANLQPDSDIGISAYIDNVNNTEMPIGYDNNGGTYVTGSKNYFKSDYEDDIIDVGTGDNAGKLVIKPFKSYTVKFMNADAIPDQVVVAGGKATKPKDEPVKPAYKFTNWIIDNDPDKPYDFNTPVNSDLNLYPNYVPYNVYVYFYHNDASGQISTRWVQYNSIISSMPDNPINKGYSFAGWYKDKALTQPFDASEKLTANMSLYGKWNKQPDVTVTFDTGGGSVIQPQTIEYSSTATKPATNPTRPGLLFAGWYTDNLYTNSYDFSNPVTNNVRIYAKWVTDPATVTNYIVAFDSNGGSIIAPQTITSGNAATRPADPVKAGYAFRNWYTDSACTSVYNFSKPVTGDLMLYAGWYKVERVVSFNTNGGNHVPDERLIDGKKAYYMETTKEGYQFLGWYTDAELTAEYDFDTPVTNSITLYAKWIQKEMTVSFDSQGGSDVAEDYPKWGGVATEPNAPVRNGYNFLGWYTDSACTTRYNFLTPVKNNITLYAKWEKGPDEETYDVTFDTSGGSAVHDRTNLAYGTLLDLSSITTQLEDYEFAGWYMKLGISVEELESLVKRFPEIAEYTWVDNNTAYILAENNYFVDGDASFKARFVRKHFTLSFFDGDDLVKTQTGPMGFIPVVPDELSKAGYNFEDWYSDPDFIYLFDFDAPIEEDTLAFARWLVEEYNISFDSNGGTPVESQKITAGEMITKPSNPTRDDDEFLGWYRPVTDDARVTDYILAECKDKEDEFVIQGGILYHEFDFDNDCVSEDTKLVAMWDVQEIYRLYNPYTTEHLYTTIRDEIYYLTSIGWNYEGVAWSSPISGDPVYRLFNPYTYEHFYTVNATEKDYLASIGWNYEGIAWYSNTDSTQDGEWVYRLFNPYESIGAHLYTLNRPEIDYLVTLGWIYEGTCWRTVK